MVIMSRQTAGGYPSKKQQNNKRNNRIITAHGESRTISEWSGVTGIGKTTIKERLNAGWSDEDSVSRPVRERKKRLQEKQRSLRRYAERKRGQPMKIHNPDNLPETIILKAIQMMQEENPGRTIAEIAVKPTAEPDEYSITPTLAKAPFERIRRITGYLVGTTDRWNDAKQAGVERQSESCNKGGQADKLNLHRPPVRWRTRERGRLRRLLKACSQAPRIARFTARYTPQGFCIANLTYLGRHGHCFEALSRCDELWLCGVGRDSRGCNMEYGFANAKGKGIPLSLLAEVIEWQNR